MSSRGKFVVQLDQADAVYMAGGSVTGRVCLYLDDTENVRGESSARQFPHQFYAQICDFFLLIK